MRRLAMRTFAAHGLLLALAACNAIAGIHEATLRGEGGADPCEAGGQCVCEPGHVRACYTGPPGTEGVGICHGGKQICDESGLGYGDCLNEQPPKPEVCDSTKHDEDCDGVVDNGFPSCTCGDGIPDPNEECDDGNEDDTDGCTGECKLPACGDGHVQLGAGEECEDGNADDTDGCTTACKLAKCGDGFVQPGNGEECDDGNADDADACTSACKRPGRVVRLALGFTHTCALLDDGRVKCWGRNHTGQLGLGDMDDRGDGPNEMGADLPAVDLGTGKTATALCAGDSYTCAVLDDGRVKCWGLNNSGQLGLGDTQNRGDGPNEMGDVLPAVDLGTGKTAVGIACWSHTCALLNDSTIKCWGPNNAGQLGQGDTESRGDEPNEMGDYLPAIKSALTPTLTAKAISVGNNFTCALGPYGAVTCWGSNGNGELGRGNTAVGSAPAAVDLGMGNAALAIGTGLFHTCARVSGDRVKCWGGDISGQLGLGDSANRGDDANEMGVNLPFVDLGAGAVVEAISAGALHSCALFAGGRVKCWGSNLSGQLGLGALDPRGDEPSEMGDNLPFIDLGTGAVAADLRAGGSSACVILGDGGIKCWGSNLFGQLGLGDTHPRGAGPGEMGDDLPRVKLFTSAW